MIYGLILLLFFNTANSFKLSNKKINVSTLLLPEIFIFANENEIINISMPVLNIKKTLRSSYQFKVTIKQLAHNLKHKEVEEHIQDSARIAAKASIFIIRTSINEGSDENFAMTLVYLPDPTININNTQDFNFYLFSFIMSFDAKKETLVLQINNEKSALKNFSL